MIVSLHVATGATAGALVRSRGRAALLGAALHGAGDAVPHHDIPSQRFELVSGLALIGLVAWRRGIASTAVVGAIAASAPDLEHILRLPRPGGRKLFPSHRVQGWHREGGLPAWTQLLAAGTLVGWVLSPSKARVSSI
jgi:hypothetical protein